jgi:hypothetical protein
MLNPKRVGVQMPEKSPHVAKNVDLSSASAARDFTVAKILATNVRCYPQKQLPQHFLLMMRN